MGVPGEVPEGVLVRRRLGEVEVWIEPPVLGWLGRAREKVIEVIQIGGCLAFATLPVAAVVVVMDTTALLRPGALAAGIALVSFVVCGFFGMVWLWRLQKRVERWGLLPSRDRVYITVSLHAVVINGQRYSRTGIVSVETDGRWPVLVMADGERAVVVHPRHEAREWLAELLRTLPLEGGSAAEVPAGLQGMRDSAEGRREGEGG